MTTPVSIIRNLVTQRHSWMMFDTFMATLEKTDILRKIRCRQLDGYDWDVMECFVLVDGTGYLVQREVHSINNGYIKITKFNGLDDCDDEVSQAAFRALFRDGGVTTFIKHHKDGRKETRRVTDQ